MLRSVMFVYVWDTLLKLPDSQAHGSMGVSWRKKKVWV